MRKYVHNFHHNSHKMQSEHSHQTIEHNGKYINYIFAPIKRMFQSVIITIIFIT